MGIEGLSEQSYSSTSPLSDLCFLVHRFMAQVLSKRRRRKNWRQGTSDAPAARIPVPAKLASSSRWTYSALIFVLATVTVGLYSPVSSDPFINYDDPNYVVQNPHIQQGLGIRTIAWALSATEQSNWHPLTWLSHAFDYQLYGMNAGGHHVTSLSFHVLNVILLFIVLAQLTGAVGRSATVAAIFALHPFNVESVAWIAERKNVLSTFFFLFTLAAYTWYVRRPNLKRYCGVAALFVLGLASKPMVITLPCVLLLLDYWPLRRVLRSEKPSQGQSSSHLPLGMLLAEKLPLFALSAGSAIVTILAQRLGRAVEPLGDLPLSIRVDNAAYSYAMYVVKFFWPSRLAVIYPHPRDKLTILQISLALFFLLVVTATAWYRREKFPYLLVGWFWFLGTLVPVIGIIQVGGQGMADRYAYLPIIGLCLMLVWGCADIAERSVANRGLVVSLAVVILLILSIVTFRQLRFWQSSYNLWAHALNVTEENFIADDGMADLLIKEGRPEALRYYEAAARLAPWDPISHGAVAASLQDRGEFTQAIREYELVLRTRPKPDVQAFSYANLGIIYGQLGDEPRVRESIGKAVQLNPDTVLAMIHQMNTIVSAHPAPAGYFRLGLLLEGTGQVSQAQSAYERALTLDPNFSSARRALTWLRRP